MPDMEVVEAVKSFIWCCRLRSNDIWKKRQNLTFISESWNLSDRSMPSCYVILHAFSTSKMRQGSAMNVKVPHMTWQGFWCEKGLWVIDDGERGQVRVKRELIDVKNNYDCRLLRLSKPQVRAYEKGCNRVIFIQREVIIVIGSCLSFRGVVCFALPISLAQSSIKDLMPTAGTDL